MEPLVCGGRFEVPFLSFFEQSDDVLTEIWTLVIDTCTLSHVVTNGDRDELLV